VSGESPEAVCLLGLRGSCVISISRTLQMPIGNSQKASFAVIWKFPQRSFNPSTVHFFFVQDPDNDPPIFPLTNTRYRREELNVL
jgi:hypothetical protein